LILQALTNDDRRCGGTGTISLGVYKVGDIKYFRYGVGPSWNKETGKVTVRRIKE